jgi:hypothetical protein
MQHSIYSRVRQHLTTALIALVVSALAGGGSAIAAKHLTFEQISGKVDGAQIRKGTIELERLAYPLQRFIENCREDCASNRVLNSQERHWEEDIALVKLAIEKKIEAEYVHK